MSVNQNQYKKKSFKIYNKYHVDKNILFLHFFCLVKWKYEQTLFFCEKKKKEADFKPKMFTFFVGKVITFPKTEIEQYVVILKV